MAFRHHKFTPVMFAPTPIEVEVATSQMDKDGIEHVSYAKVSAQSIIDKLPRPSEFTILSQMQAGTFNPVSTDDFEVSNLDSASAASFINSLNIDTNENT